MKLLKSAACLLLALLMVVGLVACGERAPAPKPSIPSVVTTAKLAATMEPEVTTGAPEEDEELFTLEELAQARIVYGANTTLAVDRGDGYGYIYQSILTLQNIIKNKHKVEVPVVSDDRAAATPYEILIGDTNREENDAIFSDLLLNDYGYAMYENKIVIKGGSDSALKTAINAFVSSIVSANVGGKKYFFSHEHDFVYRANYAAKGVKLNGTPISEFRIVYPAGATMYEKELAERLSSNLSIITGYLLPWSDDSTAYVDGTSEILIGRTNRSFQIQTTTGAAIESGGKFVAVVGSTAYQNGLAQEGLIDLIKTEALTNKNMQVTVPTKKDVTSSAAISVMAYNIYGVTNAIYQERANNVCRKVTKYLPDFVAFQEPAKNLMDLIHMEQYYNYYLGIPRHTESAPIIAGSVVINGVEHYLNGANSYAAILYAKDRYEVVEGGTKWMTNTPDEYSKLEGSDYARIYTYVMFRDKQTNEQFIIVNHHLDFASQVQVTTMKYMFKFFNENYTDIPVIMAGDMNANANSTVIKDLIQGEAGGFDSLQDMASPRVGNAMAPLDVDWIFATPCCVTGVYFTMCRDVYPDHSDARFDNGMPSDHPAAYAEMIIDSKKHCHHDWTEAASGVSWAE